MLQSDLEHFKQVLTEKEQNLRNLVELFSSLESGDTQTGQALLREVREALGRIENHTYGACQVCQGAVELHRLEVQPVRQVCLGCISPQEQAVLEEELFVASKIHRALLPQQIPSVAGWELAVRSITAGSIGGDYFDFLPTADGKSVRVVIADTMGKGLPAGLLMSNLQGALRIFAERIEEPAILVTRLNQWLCRNVPVTKFISLACIMIESGHGRTSRIRYTNAGHCPPLVVRSNDGTEFLDASGGVLGVHEGFTYAEGSLTLKPADQIILYTDGVTEARNGHDEMFGEERLKSYFSSRRNGSLKANLDDFISEVSSFSGLENQVDDLTMVALRRDLA
ncbi:MAG TPA: SpoIIE family protein phosphatase [Candidatus Deferrimicrobium sp.]|nr:SpoIIE family protein phosphatase [Candidatus Deferrimicrobium sp.]